MAHGYEDIREIGRGGFGKAILVKPRQQQYVRKEIHIAQLSDDDRTIAMREAHLLSDLFHPNIVKYLESYEHEGKLSIVMEFCEMGDLLMFMRSRNGMLFEEERIREWSSQLILALQYCHTKNIIHRDIKPDNIFLQDIDTIKLGDFGLATSLTSSTDGASTQKAGSLFYMAPELYTEGRCTKKSDIWALGCVIYELCTLKRAFRTVSDAINCRYDQDFTGYSDSLISSCKRMLTKAVHERASLEEILLLMPGSSDCEYSSNTSSSSDGAGNYPSKGLSSVSSIQSPATCSRESSRDEDSNFTDGELLERLMFESEKYNVVTAISTESTVETNVHFPSGVTSTFSFIYFVEKYSEHSYRLRKYGIIKYRKWRFEMFLKECPVDTEVICCDIRLAAGETSSRNVSIYAAINYSGEGFSLYELDAKHLKIGSMVPMDPLDGKCSWCLDIHESIIAVCDGSTLVLRENGRNFAEFPLDVQVRSLALSARYVVCQTGILVPEISVMQWREFDGEICPCLHTIFKYQNFEGCAFLENRGCFITENAESRHMFAVSLLSGEKKELEGDNTVPCRYIGHSFIAGLTRMTGENVVTVCRVNTGKHFLVDSDFPPVETPIFV